MPSPNQDEPNLAPMLGALLRRPLRALTVKVAADLATAGFADLRPSHLVVFQGLDAAGSRLTDLAARAHVTKQSMGALVDDLERMGYVERLPDASDGRVKMVCRTEKGWAVERAARASVAAFETEWTRRVGTDRMRQFRDVLEQFGESADATTPSLLPSSSQSDGGEQ